ncbi:MAG TPA: RsmE family RNA methyltransferase [Thermoanaerobaculia bacterium]|nr:RsmE family RNA methyltransferase [Thermoanaerobaculia bacterium]
MDAGAVMTPTLVVTATELQGDRVVLRDEAYRHLFRARRLGREDRLRLTDGAGRARFAAIAELDRRQAVLRLLGPAPANDPRRRVTLLVATPRPERAAWLVEKATELGVAAIGFLASSRSVREIDAKGLARLQRVAVAALEQCGGASLPRLSGPHRSVELPALLAGTRGYVLDPAATTPLPVADADPVTVLVGPEGGWAADELAALGELSFGGLPVAAAGGELAAAAVRGASLGSRILRVETAAVAAAALLLASR